MAAISELVPHERNNADEIQNFFVQNELLADPATRRDYFEHMDEQGFIQLLQQTAQLVRTGDASQLQYFDGKDVKLMTHDVPDQREKAGLLADVWHATQDILKDRNLSDQDALEYAGLTVAGGVLLTHPFADGNGRTSRTLSYVMIRGTEAPNELNAILAKSNGGGDWDIAPNPEIRASYTRPFAGDQPKRIEWAGFYIDDADDAFGGEIAKSLYKDNIMRRFIEEADEETMHLVQQAMKSTVGEGSGSTLDANKLMEILAATEGSSHYAQHLFAIMRSERAKAVKGFLEGMCRPDVVAKTDKIDMYRTMRNSERQIRRANRAEKEMAKRALADGRMALRDQSVVMHKTFSGVYGEVEEKQ